MTVLSLLYKVILFSCVTWGQINEIDIEIFSPIALGTASVAKGYSGYLDALVDHKMSRAFKDVWDIHEGASPTLKVYIAEYFDFFAFGATFFTSGMLL